MKLAVLAALEQRVALRYTMPPMTSQETSSYIGGGLVGWVVWGVGGLGEGGWVGWGRSVERSGGRRGEGGWSGVWWWE